MTIQEAQKNIGFFFTIGNHRCQVTQGDSFSGVTHYGFVTVPSPADKGRLFKFTCGWIPVEFAGQCELTA